MTRERLAGEYPGDAKALCALMHDTPFQLLVATIMSAQTTDEMVNSVTPAPLRPVPGPGRPRARGPGGGRGDHPLDRLLPAEDQEHHRHGAAAVEERFDGEVPTELADLVTLARGRPQDRQRRAVGRVRACPGLPVDTHVGRLSKRLKLTNETDPVKVELDLNGLIPAEERGAFSLRLILHGRRICIARKPKCGECLSPTSARRRHLSFQPAWTSRSGSRRPRTSTAIFDVRAQAFAIPESDRERWTTLVDPAGMVTAFLGTKVVGSLNVLELGQWFGGRAIPMGGVATVVVRPEHRGEGIAAGCSRRRSCACASGAAGEHAEPGDDPGLPRRRVGDRRRPRRAPHPDPLAGAPARGASPSSSAA